MVSVCCICCIAVYNDLYILHFIYTIHATYTHYTLYIYTHIHSIYTYIYTLYIHTYTLYVDEIKNIDKLSIDRDRDCDSDRGVPILVSDPAVVELFAKYYRCGDRNNSSAKSNSSSNSGSTGTVTGTGFTSQKQHYNTLLVEICEWNHSVALLTQISSRAAVWSSLLLLLPILIENKPEVEVEAEPESVHGHNRGKSELKKHKDLNGKDRGKDREKDISGTIPASHPIESMSSQSPLLFTTEILQKMFLELLDEGDVQHFALCYELLLLIDLHTVICPGIITEARLREVYLSYIDMLHSLQLFAEANLLLKYSNDKYLGTALCIYVYIWCIGVYRYV